ncbi:MAG TPA: hypothetical protein VK065_06625 [Brevibacterium sp.]|nr:hypothetical protein [Brevibacterium sp.]
MDMELLGLPAEVGTALALIATGVIVPGMTSLLSSGKIPSNIKRWIPIVLAAAGAGIIVVLQGGGPIAERLLAWIVVAGVVVGMAQTLYAAMPKAWKGLEAATSRVVADEEPPSGLAGDAPRGQDGTNTAGGHRGAPEPLRGSQSGLERSVDESTAEYRRRTLNQPDGEDYTRG